MASEALSYLGINRAVSDYSGTKACEELINMRPTTEGLVPAKDFSAFATDVAWKRIFVHHSTHGDKYFVVTRDSGTSGYVYVKPLGGLDGITPQAEKFKIAFTSDAMAERIIESISFATAGNIVLFSVCDRTDSKYENHSYVCKESGYVDWDATIPTVTVGVSDGAHSISKSQDIMDLDKDSSPNDVVTAVQSAVNAVQESDTALCLGPIIIATAFKTRDGQTFWTSSWKVYDPVPKIDGDTINNRIVLSDIPSSSILYTEEQSFFQNYGYGYALSWPTDGSDRIAAVSIYGTHVDVTLTLGSSWDKETSLIESIEVYSSKPQLYLDIPNSYQGFDIVEYNQVWSSCLIVPQVKYNKMELGGQLMYLQSSVTLESLTAGPQTVHLAFGGNLQVVKDTLDTDTGELTRAGKVISYNARFHYFDSVSSLKISMPSFSQSALGAGERGYVFVEYTDEDRSVTRYLGYVDGLDHTNPADIVIAPSLNIRSVTTYFVIGSGHGTSWSTITYRMQPSSSYNYTICQRDVSYDGGSGTSSDYDTSHVNDVIQTEERNAINVSERYNPFVFDVAHSYLAPGIILDVKPQMAGIVDSSYGRDPLNVFTVRGVYALTQGSANVLYGAFLPVTDDVISGASVPTEMGVFYLADGALWLMSGRKATLVSDALHLGPHKFIRGSQGYQKISGVDTQYDPSSTVTDPVYDVSGALSQVPFDLFVKGDSVQGISAGRLAFNRFRMELYVSNPSFDYTYVLSMKYRQWYKVDRRIWQDESGSDLASVPGSGVGQITVLKLSVETDAVKTIHLQTRPFSFGYSYAHVHRIVAMMRAALSGTTQRLALGLYGSDNLQDWTLLAYAKRSGSSTTVQEVTTDDPPLRFSQIRTSSAARSWRYYTVCLGGVVNTSNDLDLGPILVDYEPVIRRIG